MMKIEKRRLSDIKPNAENVRRHNSLQIEELKKSIKKFDVIRPIVIDENGVILAGHGLFEALTQLGYTEADVIVKKGLSDREKKKLLLADNKVFMLGHDDFDVIEKLLTELGADNDFEIPGYDAETLEALYGVQSLERDSRVEETLAKASPDSKYFAKDVGSDYSTEENPIPSKRIEQERAEAEKVHRVIICPNCGEKIWL